MQLRQKRDCGWLLLADMTGDQTWILDEHQQWEMIVRKQQAITVQLCRSWESNHWTFVKRFALLSTDTASRGCSDVDDIGHLSALIDNQRNDRKSPAKNWAWPMSNGHQLMEVHVFSTGHTHYSQIQYRTTMALPSVKHLICVITAQQLSADCICYCRSSCLLRRCVFCDTSVCANTSAMSSLMDASMKC